MLLGQSGHCTMSPDGPQLLDLSGLMNLDVYLEVILLSYQRNHIWLIDGLNGESWLVDLFHEMDDYDQNRETCTLEYLLWFDHSDMTVIFLNAKMVRSQAEHRPLIWIRKRPMYESGRWVFSNIGHFKPNHAGWKLSTIDWQNAMVWPNPGWSKYKVRCFNWSISAF